MRAEESRSGAHRLEVNPVDELQDALESERHARDESRAELEQQTRLAAGLEGLLSAACECSKLEQLAPRLLSVLLQDLDAGVGELWLRDGALLTPRASLGISAPSDVALPAQRVQAEQPSERQAWLVSPVEAGVFEGSAALRHPGVAALLCVAFTDSEGLLGVAGIGLSELPSLSEDDERRLALLARHASAVVAQCQGMASVQHAVRSRDEVLGIVAHDLRNPLNVIAAAANSLHQRMPDSVARRPVERIIRAAQRAEHLIRDLLDIYAIEGGSFSIERRQLDTANVILAAIESQQGLAASSSVILASDLSPELPWVDADEERMLEVLENLLGNAVKFTMAGGTVTLGAAAREQEVVIWVKDNGPGVPAEQLPHLFDRFWQATRSDRRGTGLGLTICKAIVEAHGGRIWAESEPGQGTTVFFSVPARVRSPNSNRRPVANILLVDDRPENLLSLKAILEGPEYRLVTASSGEDALSLALRENFAVALIDVAMPGMDGLEVAIHMKELERSRDIPIIFITAFGDDPEEIHRAYSAGGADYLVKPLDAEIVRKKVAVFTDLSRRRDESADRLKLKEEA